MPKAVDVTDKPTLALYKPVEYDADHKRWILWSAQTFDRDPYIYVRLTNVPECMCQSKPFVLRIQQHLKATDGAKQANDLTFPAMFPDSIGDPPVS